MNRFIESGEFESGDFSSPEEMTGTLENSKSLEELYERLAQHKGIIVSSQGPLFPESVIGMIQDVEAGLASIDTIPRAEGLRVTVARLLTEGGVYLKPSETKPTPIPVEAKEVVDRYSEVENFDELHQRILSHPGLIMSSQGALMPDQVTFIIEKVRAGEGVLGQIPRTDGLRSTVQRLLEQEKSKSAA